MRLIYLIAPWGNPEIWQRRIYEIGGRAYEAISSLIALMRYARETGVAVTVAMIPDTLASAYTTDSSTLKILRSTWERILRTGSYEAVLNLALTRVNRVISNKEGLLRFVVLPSTGIFLSDTSYRYSASPQDYKIASVLYHLINLASIEFHLYDEFEFWIDVSHGVNYHVLFSYEVASILASIVSRFTSRKVLLRVFQAMPSLGAHPKQVIPIHQLQVSEVNPTTSYPEKLNNISSWQTIFKVRVQRRPFPRPEGLRKWLLSWGRLGKAYNLLLFAQENALLLPFLALPDNSPELPSWSELENSSKTLTSLDILSEIICKGIMRIYFDYTEISRVDGEIVIEHLLSLSEEVIKPFEMLSTLRYFSNLKDRALHLGIFHPDESAINLDLLKMLPLEVRRSLIPMASETAFHVFNNELGDEGEGIGIHALRAKAKPQYTKVGSLIVTRGGTSKRNFIAHSGFERNLMEVRLDVNGHLLVRYSPEAWNLLIKLLS